LKTPNLLLSLEFTTSLNPVERIESMNIYYDKDANLAALHQKRCVIGYGSQGFAQSNNLLESGCDVTWPARIVLGGQSRTVGIARVRAEAAAEPTS